MEEDIKPQKVVIGQRIQEAKVILVRQMRREMTVAEAMLWERLRRKRLGFHFRRQQIIDGFIADFYCHEAALVVEVDGPTHDMAYDAERDQVFAARGISVLHFTNPQVYDTIGLVVSQIRCRLNAGHP